MGYGQQAYGESRGQDVPFTKQERRKSFEG
jgi:hypothetical protein